MSRVSWALLVSIAGLFSPRILRTIEHKQNTNRLPQIWRKDREHYHHNYITLDGVHLLLEYNPLIYFLLTICN